MQKIWTNKRIINLILFIFLAIYQTVVMATEEPIVPDCLLKAPHTPVFKVRDTVNKYGRYSKVNKTITFESADIDRFQILQWDYARLLVNRPWQETAQLLVVPTN